MGVAVYHSLNGQNAQIFVDQLQRRLGAFRGHQRVKDNPAGVTLDEGDIGQIIAPHLIDAVAYLKQTVDVVKLGVSPQTGVGCGGRIAVQEIIGLLAPNQFTLRIPDFQSFRAGNQAAGGVVKFRFVLKVQQGIHLLVGIRSELGGGLLLGGQTQLLGHVLRRSSDTAAKGQCTGTQQAEKAFAVHDDALLTSYGTRWFCRTQSRSRTGPRRFHPYRRGRPSEG